MDYIKELPVERLKKVIAGEQGGVSTEVGWLGGGSFVYCELAELNQKIINKIQAAGSDNDLLALWKDIENTGFISYKIRPSKIDAHIDDFKALSMEDKKRFLMEVLDKNMLYVNYSDIDDEDFGISDENKAFNKSFYEKE